MKRYFSVLALLIAAVCWLGSATANDVVPWQNLSPAEREVLQPHADRWDYYPPNRQQRLQENADRYMELSPNEKKRLKRSRREYMQKSPEERRMLRETYRRKHKNPQRRHRD